VLGNGFVGDNFVGRVRFGANVPIDMKTPKTKSVKHKSRTPFFKKRNPIAEAASQAEREKYDAVMRAKTPHVSTAPTSSKRPITDPEKPKL